MAATHLRRRETALDAIDAMREFDELDFPRHERAVHELHVELRALEERNDELRTLQARLVEREQHQNALPMRSENLLRREQELVVENREARTLVARHEAALARSQADGSYAIHSESFADLDAKFAASPLTLENFAVLETDDATGEERSYHDDRAGQSGGEKAKLAFTILIAAIAFQYDLDPQRSAADRFHFVVVDEMVSRVDDGNSACALELFRSFVLQLLIVAPLDAKARVTEDFVGCYLLVTKDERTNRSQALRMTAREFAEQAGGSESNADATQRVAP